MASTHDNTHRNLATSSSTGERKNEIGKTFIDRPEALLDSLRIDMGGQRVENFRVLFLDVANRLIRDETLWRGTINSVQVHPREVIRQALVEDATALILIHNHPSGDVEPSRQDKILTRQIGAAARLLNITLHDHIIVGREMCNSMRRSHPSLFLFDNASAGEIQ